MQIVDDPNNPQTEDNTLPKYQAVWRAQDGMVQGKAVKRMATSGWRDDKDDTIALAERMNGHCFRGYFPKPQE